MQNKGKYGRSRLFDIRVGLLFTDVIWRCEATPIFFCSICFGSIGIVFFVEKDIPPPVRVRGLVKSWGYLRLPQEHS